MHDTYPIHVNIKASREYKARSENSRILPSGMEIVVVVLVGILDFLAVPHWPEECAGR